MLFLASAGCAPQPVAPLGAGHSEQTADHVARPVSSTENVIERAVGSGTLFQFRDVTKEMNLEFTRFDDMRGQNRNQEANGGGVAMMDFDLDGQLDLFFPQGCRLPLRTLTQEFSNEFFWNRAGRFQKVTDQAGLKAVGFFTGCTVGDFDEDGFADLYVAAFGRTSMYRNNGDGSFSDITLAAEASVNSWSTSALFADLNRDGLLDLFIPTYLDSKDDPPKICKEPRSPNGTMQCSPTQFEALADFLFVNNGQGEFIDVTREAGITAPDGKGLGSLACDLTGDGWLDVHVANDTTPSFLYVNETAAQVPAQVASTLTLLPRFQNRGTEFGIATNGEGKITAAMGIAHGDYDRDGWIDLYVTNFYLEANTLFRNLGGTGFADLSSASRLGPPSRSTLAFGTEFFDIDHDGWLDLLVTNGHIEDRDWTKVESYRMHPHLFRNERNGKFTDIAATAGSYFTAKWVGRGLALGDIDRDGDLDVIMAQQIDPSAILRNDTPSRATSVVIKPVGGLNSPRSGIGAKVIAMGVSPVLLRDIAGGGSFQSASALEFHLGLAGAPQFDQLECTWPDGQVEHWSNVMPGYYVALQGRGLVRINGIGSWSDDQ